MKLASLLLLCLFLCSLALTQNQAAAPAPTDPAQQLKTSHDNAYRLFPGDVVDIRFLLNPELNESVQIRPDGRIAMRFVGEVELSGHTVEEATKMIEERFSQYLKDPKVSIQIRGYAAQKVYVSGEVERPGVVVLPGDMTLLAAIGEAGGVRRTGTTKNVVLIRKGLDNLPHARKVALMRGGKPSAEAALLLRPYDMILVPESGVARLDRWVDQYLRKTNPINLSMGFSYIFNQTGFLTF